MTIPIPETLLTISNINNKLDRDLFAHISRKPKNDVANEMLESTTFLISDPQNQLTVKAKVLEIKLFSIFFYNQLLYGKFDYNNEEFGHMELLGFDYDYHENGPNPFQFLTDYIKSKPDISFEDDLGFYIFKKIS